MLLMFLTKRGVQETSACSCMPINQMAEIYSPSSSSSSSSFQIFRLFSSSFTYEIEEERKENGVTAKTLDRQTQETLKVLLMVIGIGH